MGGERRGQERRVGERNGGEMREERGRVEGKGPKGRASLTQIPGSAPALEM